MKKGTPSVQRLPKSAFWEISHGKINYIFDTWHTCLQDVRFILMTLAFAYVLFTGLLVFATRAQAFPTTTLRLAPADNQHEEIKFFMRAGSDSYKTFDIIANNPDFAGVKKTYIWRNIEPTEGVYDFSEIEGDLTYLQSIGKRLWIEIKFVQFNGTEPPNSPSYMWRNSKYGGDSRYYGNYERTTQSGGWTPVWWNTEVKARLTALYKALGARFNGESYIEGINLSETSVGTSPEYGGTKDNVLEAFKHNALECKKVFSDKVVIQMINYAPYDLPSFAEWCVSQGIGIGGPDVKFDAEKKNALNTIVYPLYLKYHDLVPTGPDVQWDNYEQINPDTGVYYTAEELLQGTIEKMNPHYIFWLNRSPYFTRDVIPAVRKYKSSYK